MRLTLCLFAILCVTLIACQSGPQPPQAQKVPKELEAHGDVRIDDYYWLRERENPEVINYLEAENEYTAAMMAHTGALQKTLVEEFKTRIKQDDTSVPYRVDDYYYYDRSVEGEDYKVYCRKKGSLEGDEEILLDANELAGDSSFFSLRSRVSPEHDLIAYGTDKVGRRFYTVRFKELKTGKILPDTLSDVTGNLAWANDNLTLFYSKQDPETLRSFQVYRHVLGTDPAQDDLVYEEADETFSVYVRKTKSEKYILISSDQTLSTEVRYLDADKPDGDFVVFLPRREKLEYSIDHLKDRFYIRTNLDASNFRLMETKVGDSDPNLWQEKIPHRDDVFFVDFEVFADHLVIEERENGLIQIRILPWSGQEEFSIEFDEPAYSAGLSYNPELATTLVRYSYESMTTPTSTFDFDMETQEKTLLKQVEVRGGFNSDNYVTERLWATADDNTKIPISIVYAKELEKDGSNPLLLYGYGSYGSTTDARFSATRISLIDRGFAYAIAHVRGGQELGRRWYEDGKLLKKKNTFTDFIACGEFLVAQGYTSPDRQFAMGGSAGGLLMGAVINMAPGLFKGVIAQVPWVDVITTMLDPDIPLTTSEFDEWGDPHKREYYDYMLSYSPYDQVEKKGYPSLFVTTGLHDSQVQYWEPAKWVAKLRTMKTDDNLLLLRTNMNAGHGGASGRYGRYAELAFEYAFLLDLAGVKQ
jgi:oligopeptidase B